MNRSNGQFALAAIGVVHSPRLAPSDDYWGDVEAAIALDSRFGAEALLGLADFSHAEIVLLMHGVDPGSVETGARHPRERLDWPRVGIFAQRGRARPNRLGLSRCGIVRVKEREITVRGLDAIDGTPVLDIKPYMKEFGPRGAVREPAWASELMQNYYKASE